MGRTLRTGTASIFVAVVLLASAIPQVHASLIGDTVDLSWHEPTPTTLIEDDGLQVVGPGVEYPSVLANLFTANVGASTLTVSHTGPFSTIPSLTIAYYDFRLTDLTDPIIAASIDPANTVTLLTPADITVANGAVSVDLVGYLWGVNQNMVLDLVTAVPEPGSLSLLVTAVAGFGLIRRRKRA